MGWNMTEEACNQCGRVCEYDCETHTIYCPDCGSHEMSDPWLAGGGIQQASDHRMGAWKVEDGYARKP